MDNLVNNGIIDGLMPIGVLLVVVGFLSVTYIVLSSHEEGKVSGGIALVVSQGTLIIGTLITGAGISEEPVVSGLAEGNLVLQAPFFTHMLIPAAILVLLSIFIPTACGLILTKYRKYKKAKG